MSAVTILGAGNIAQSVARIATDAGSTVQILARDSAQAAQAAQATGAQSGALGDAITGDVVVLALPYPAVAEVLAPYADALAGKVVVDPTNPLDFSTFDDLVVPADSSAAAQIQALVPQARVVKAFNTNFAATLAAGTVNGQPTTVLIAGDDADAKTAVADVVRGGGLQAIDAGSLKRAREVEAIGFLQLTLAGAEKIAWTDGFRVVTVA